jgi:hypothetical protein
MWCSSRPSQAPVSACCAAARQLLLRLAMSASPPVVQVRNSRACERECVCVCVGGGGAHQP